MIFNYTPFYRKNQDILYEQKPPSYEDGFCSSHEQLIKVNAVFFQQFPEEIQF